MFDEFHNPEINDVNHDVLGKPWVIKEPGTFCEICFTTFGEDGWRRQSQTFGFCCTRCTTRACRLVRRHNRRANLARVKGKLFSFDWLLQVYAHSFSCAHCKVRKKDLTLDHIRPLSMGGLNLAHNIQPLCQECHMEKDNIRPRRLDS